MLTAPQKSELAGVCSCSFAVHLHAMSKFTRCVAPLLRSSSRHDLRDRWWWVGWRGRRPG
jgi:hypothetical protein